MFKIVKTVFENEYQEKKSLFFTKTFIQAMLKIDVVLKI